MPRYENGRAPLNELVRLGDQHYLPIGTCARWQELQRLAWEKYRVRLVISPGWNGYRPFNIQVEYRDELGIWAALPGLSSHGLVYQGRECAAIDVFNWRDLAPGNESLAWARFVTLCRLTGFTVDFVTPRELWHIGDFNDIWTAPAFASVVINPATTARPQSEEDDMAIVIKREATGQTFTVAPGNYIKIHPGPTDKEQKLALYSYQQGTPRGYSEGDLSLALWDFGFPELGGDLGRLPNEEYPYLWAQRGAVA